MTSFDTPSPHSGDRSSAFTPRAFKPGLVLLLVVLCLTGLTLWPALDVLRPAKDVTVQAVLPARAEASQTLDVSAAVIRVRTVQAAGWVEPDPYFVAVTAETDGIVQAIHVLEGESVEQGQLIAELIDEDARLSWRQAEARVVRATAWVAQAQAKRDAAQTDWDEPVERERSVASTQAALAEARAELALLPSRVAEAQALRDQSAEELNRLEEAAQRGAATEREVLVMRYELASRDAMLRAVHDEEALLQARVERLASEARAAERAAELRVDERRALDAAIAQLADAQAQLTLAEAEHDEAALRLSRMRIHAPISGNVLRRLQNPGDRVRLGMDERHAAHLVHLYDPAMLQVRVDVPLADASQVYVGQTCEVIVEVLPDETFAGEVTRITHQADLQKNTLEVQVRIIEPSPWLKPEMLARVRFIGTLGDRQVTDTSGDQAVLREVRVAEACLDGERVWVVRERRGARGAVIALPVTIVGRDDAFAQVRGALHVGDLLVTQPAGLDQGMSVHITHESQDESLVVGDGEGGDA